jgi:hypothetical protein
MARPGGRKQDAASPLSPFAAVNDTKHDKALAIPSVLKDVFGFQDLQNNLPILVITLDRTAEFWILR